MALYKNVAGQKIGVFAYDKTTGAAKTGDAANITGYLSLDFGTAAAVTDTNPTELSSANMPGWYVFDLTQAETNAESLILAPKSSTSNIVIDQIQAYTADSLVATSTALSAVGGNVDSILADTNELQTDWVNGGRLDLILDARASQTSVDDLPTNAELSSALTGMSTLDAAGVRTAVGLASANLDTQLGDLPTNSELNARTLASGDYFNAATDDVTLAAGELAGLSTLTAAQVWSYVTRELTSAGSGGATAQEVWEYATRTLTGKTGFELTAAYDAAKTAASASAVQAVDDLVDDLESRLTAARAGYLDKLNVSGTLAHSDDAATYKADVSGLATAAAVAALNNLSAAEAQTAAGAALTAYDAATGADVSGISVPTATQIADAVLKRGVVNIEDTADAGSLAELLLGAFESAVSGTTWTIRKTGGGTFSTRTVATDPNADPIVSVT